MLMLEMILMLRMTNIRVILKLGDDTNVEGSTNANVRNDISVWDDIVRDDTNVRDKY